MKLLRWMDHLRPEFQLGSDQFEFQLGTQVGIQLASRQLGENDQRCDFDGDEGLEVFLVFLATDPGPPEFQQIPFPKYAMEPAPMAPRAPPERRAFRSCKCCPNRGAVGGKSRGRKFFSLRSPVAPNRTKYSKSLKKIHKFKTKVFKFH